MKFLLVSTRRTNKRIVEINTLKDLEAVYLANDYCELILDFELAKCDGEEVSGTIEIYDDYRE